MLTNFVSPPDWYGKHDLFFYVKMESYKERTITKYEISTSVAFEQLDFKLIIKDSEYDSRVIDLELFEDISLGSNFLYSTKLYLKNNILLNNNENEIKLELRNKKNEITDAISKKYKES